ncbi:MAG: ATP-binding protein, partial [Myxococcaceae bacterium]
MSQCARCFGKSYVIDRKGDRAVASVCSCQLPCPRCGGIGHTYAIQESQFSAKVGKRKYEVLVPCSCNLLKTRVERFNDVDLPGIYARADFDGFSTSAMRPQIVEALKKAKETALRFAMGFNKTNPGRGYVLAGPVGTGKTHLLASTLQHLALELGVRCKYVEISLLYATIRRGFQEGKSGGEIISPLSEIDVLAIDELGKGRGSQFEQETLDELIARRYNAGRTTLFGTN